MTAEEADLRLTRVLRGRAADWVRRYTIEQCALIAEDAALMTESGHRDRAVPKTEMARRAMTTANRIRALAKAVAP